jgi:hypothetical protein
MLFWLGTILSGYLGYRMHQWWVPAALSVLVAAAQAVQFRGSGYELIVLSLILNLVVFHATFGIGQALGQRIRQRRKGTR